MPDERSQNLLPSFFKDGTLRTFSKEEVVYDSGVDKRYVYKILSGYVKSYVISDEGKTNTISMYGPGSIFPLGPTLRGSIGHTPYHLLRTVYFEAITPVELSQKPGSDFLKLLEEDISIYKDLTLGLINNYELYLRRVEGSFLKHARDRVAYQLIALAERFAAELHGQLIIQVPLTHQDLADSLGMARETVSREIEDLRKDGIISSKDKHFIINNRKALEDIIVRD